MCREMQFPERILPLNGWPDVSRLPVSRVGNGVDGADGGRMTDLCLGHVGIESFVHDLYQIRRSQRNHPYLAPLVLSVS